MLCLRFTCTMCSVLNSKPSRERRKKYCDDDENKSRAGCNVMDIKRCVQFAIYFRFVISDDDSQRREHFSHQFYSKRRLSSPRFHIFQVSEAQRKIKNRRGNRLENNIERLSLQVHLWSSCIVILLLDISVAVEYDARAREISCNYQQTLFFVLRFRMLPAIENFDTLQKFLYSSRKFAFASLGYWMHKECSEWQH